MAATYKIDGTQNIESALGFIKDWVTALIQLQTAGIGAIGAFMGLSTYPKLSVLQGTWVTLTVVAFIASIVCGGTLLHMLPGCVQRTPLNAEARAVDVYSMTTVPPRTVYYWARLFWIGFLSGIVFFGLFIVARIW